MQSNIKKVIAISFTLKNQDFNKICGKLIEIDTFHPDGLIVVHGFMPKHVVLEKGFDTTVVDKLEDLFPFQLNCYRANQPLRKSMAAIVKQFEGTVYVIGNVEAGVKEEVGAYEEMGVEIKYIPLD